MCIHKHARNVHVPYTHACTYAFVCTTKQKAAMEERLRKKAELQKKASKPVGYQQSIRSEIEKQNSLKKSKEERRIALCEELGRGC